MQENTSLYTVEEVISEAADVATLRLRHAGQTVPPYVAGQFITIFFPETGHLEGKAYSLSSSPCENCLCITVRGIGIFSRMLLAKKVGDTINGSLPYGYFYSESEPNSMVMIAGGIGIAPLRSMIKQSRQLFPERKISLLYSAKTNESIVFEKEFDELSRQSGGNFVSTYYITQGKPRAHQKEGRIPLQDIVGHIKASCNQEFFICGSIAFVRDYWRAVQAAGVSEEKIYTEAFF